MPYSLFLFDYDGTLCDTRRAILYGFERTFEHYGVPEPAPEVVHAMIGRGLVLGDMLQQLRPELSAAEVAEWVVTYRQIYAREAEPLVTPFPGALALFAQLTEQGVLIGVLSNKGAAVLEASLAQVGLLPFVALVIGDGTMPEKQLAKKPDPMVFHEVVKPRFPEVPTNRMLMIGDTTADLQFAHNSQIDSCWVTFGFGEEAQCRALQPTHTVSHLLEIPALRRAV
ncbi:HAD family hydrolase [Hymenobacter cellulosilyticus]|uniref:phosphoglycolate phosphatase n=1 Tax=Hymenobacter cellulosilyticus TaxID=2932248 RepID=A0A8T9PZL7_9BACT|nr:HAD family hydrolase [Hymenobacter cellulosilyticus]UOQ70664.1 HAD family hydrolase [Hymenobacter cellulosilyticus]